jgi:transmembrane sensor
MDISTIERFFEKKCTAEEAEQVAEYLKSNPELLESLLSKNEWDDAEVTEIIPRKFWKDVWLNIQKKKTGKARLLWIKKLSVAASILLVIGSAWIYLIQNKDSNRPVTIVANKTASLRVVFQHKINTTAKKMSIKLQDGSEVVLSPGSELNYGEPFTDNKRTVYLKGEAFFAVAKDATKPFTVYTDALSTTDLGTRFLVTAFQQEDNITIRLFEGKVVVKSSDSIHKKLAEDMYLLPGNKLVYNRMSMLASISSFTKSKSIAGNKKINPDKTYTSTSDWYMFNNQNLADVLERLKELYGTDIQYSKEALKNSYFIGKFNMTDSLEKILNDIALLKNLTVEKHGNSFIIKK